MAEHCLHFSDRWRNETLVILRVGDEDELREWGRRLIAAGHNKIASFREPYYQNQMTALAVTGDEKLESLFALLPLVK